MNRVFKYFPLVVAFGLAGAQRQPHPERWTTPAFAV